MSAMKNDKSRLLKSAQRRRRERGVAMVEGAVVFPIMAMFMVMFELAHHSFDAYITTEHVAEERTWSSATLGSFTLSCPTGRDDTEYSSQVKYFTITAGGSPTDTKAGGSPSTNSNGGKINGNSMAGQGPSGWAMHSDTAAATAKASRGAGSFTTTPNARSKVFCNQPWVGGLWAIVSSI
jgi:hypothetical protein